MDANRSAARWWHGATLYQVYVRSWLDTNGDGYGDLPGVMAKLDYLAWLGVDGIWLSPTMPSPDDDWGYDVSDYLGVHPELGTLDDLDRLVAEADQRNMKVLLDLVPNHTSTAHPWFVEAISGRDSAHRSYYVWADPAPGGGPPTNWLDATGHSAWAFDEASGQYYLHNFLASQADLNWWEPAVHEEFREILRFWFDRGIAGFRIDVAQGLYKDAELRDDPPSATPDRLHSRFGLEPGLQRQPPGVAQRVPGLAQDRGELLPAAAAAGRDMGERTGQDGRVPRSGRRTPAHLQLPVHLRRLHRAGAGPDRRGNAGRAAGR